MYDTASEIKAGDINRPIQSPPADVENVDLVPEYDT
jgi:hypothetical protein